MAGRRFEIPSKIILLGEYSVLAGSKALVAANGPAFVFEEAESHDWSPHPESPAGRILNGKIPPIRFQDPFQGAGGFGASSAEAVFALRDLSRCQSIQEGYARYLETFPPHSKPSGADFTAQWIGGVSLVQPSTQEVKVLKNQKIWNHLLVFQASHLPNRKVATHEHLKNLKKVIEDNRPLLVQAGKWVDQAAQAMENSDVKKFAESVLEFMNALSPLRLETHPAKQDREALITCPGVLAAKGIGAGFSDAVLVVIENPDLSNPILKNAVELGLKRIEWP